MNDENNQKDEGTEEIPYIRCSNCKYLKRADIFSEDEHKCPKCGATSDLKELEDSWLTFYRVNWPFANAFLASFILCGTFMYYFWNSIGFLNSIEIELGSQIKVYFFFLLFKHSGISMHIANFILLGKPR